MGNYRFGSAIAELPSLPISVARKGHIPVTRMERSIQILG